MQSSVTLWFSLFVRSSNHGICGKNRKMKTFKINASGTFCTEPLQRQNKQSSIGQWIWKCYGESLSTNKIQLAWLNIHLQHLYLKAGWRKYTEDWCIEQTWLTFSQNTGTSNVRYVPFFPVFHIRTKGEWKTKQGLSSWRHTRNTINHSSIKNVQRHCWHYDIYYICILIYYAFGGAFLFLKNLNILNVYE
jgi:hypothetical protein